MSYIPIFMDMKGKRVVIVGGGKVAFRRARVLCQAQAEVVAVAPVFHEKMEEMENSGLLTLRQGEIEEIDLCGADMVIAAAPEEINQKVEQWCRKRHILMSTASGESSSKEVFRFPSVIKWEGICVGVSTDTKNPVLSRYVREKLEEALREIIPPGSEELFMEMENERKRMLEERLSEEELRGKLREQLKEGLEKKGWEGVCRYE